MGVSGGVLGQPWVREMRKPTRHPDMTYASGPVPAATNYLLMTNLPNILSTRINNVSSWLSDRCPGLTERSRFRVPGGFSRCRQGPPPYPPYPPKMRQKALYFPKIPPNTQFCRSGHVAKSKRSVFDIEGFWGFPGGSWASPG